MEDGRILEIAAIAKGRESSLRDYRRVKVNDVHLWLLQPAQLCILLQQCSQQPK